MLALLRYRDIVALLCFVVLVQMSWHPHHQYDDSTMSGKFQLSWYTNTSHIITNPIVLDMNGDSNPDVLLIPQSIGLQFLPITSSNNNNNKVSSSSLEYISTIPTSTISYINDDVPLKIQGHYFFADKQEDRNVCGLDFKDASLHCHEPCPCKNSKYKCFSQVTNCFSQEDDEPCITVFNQPSNTLTMTCYDKIEKQWQLRWKSPLLAQTKNIQNVDWIISKETSSIIFTITFLLEDENQTSKTIYQSIQLHTGELQWSHDNQITKIMEEKKSDIPTTNYAFERRRSRISEGTDEEDTSMDCMHYYRYWMIQNAFPHNQQQQSSLLLSHLHNKQSKLKQQTNNDDKTKDDDEKVKKKKITISNFWKQVLLNVFRHNNHTTTLPQNQKKLQPKMNQHHLNNFNVLIHHNHDGIHVRSLKNGQPICHVSLSPDKYFIDINHDNIIDEIQIYTPSTATSNNDDDKNDEDKLNVHNNNRKTIQHKRDVGIYKGHECSIVARSGIQLPQEELFRQQTICPEYHTHHTHDIDILPPILVKEDIIVATNTGRIVSHRVHGGSLSWEQSNHPIKRSQQTLDEKFKLPTWSSTVGATNVALLQLIDFPIIQKISKTKKQTIMASKINHNRPILFCGQDGCTLISPSNAGRLLSSTAFPQSSLYPPIVADFNRDGIDDVIIFSQDGIWGFSIHMKLHSFKHTWKRILIVVLFIGISAAAAIHINNTNPKTRGKRSTDHQTSSKKYS